MQSAASTSANSRHESTATTERSKSELISTGAWIPARQSELNLDNESIPDVKSELISSILILSSITVTKV